MNRLGAVQELVIAAKLLAGDSRTAVTDTQRLKANMKMAVADMVKALEDMEDARMHMEMAADELNDATGDRSFLNRFYKADELIDQAAKLFKSMQGDAAKLKE